MKGKINMKDEENKKMNMLITMLMNPENTVIDNIDIELKMQSDLQRIAEEWKKKGWIKRYMIAPDEFISDSLKTQAEKMLDKI